MRRRAALVIVLSSLALPAAITLAGESEIVPPPSRDVTPPGFTPAPAGSGPLIREPVAPPPPDPPRWHRFVLPETIDAATFRVRSATIRISGVTALAADATCGAIEGTPFPCGRTGLFALRMFLQGRTVECYFPPVGDAARIIAPCRVGKTDLGLWLLSAGWAKPDANATEAYRAASAAARCAHRGLWRNEPPPPGCHAAARGGTP